MANNGPIVLLVDVVAYVRSNLVVIAPPVLSLLIAYAPRQKLVENIVVVGPLRSCAIYRN